jgi:hypothetical protein
MKFAAQFLLILFFVIFTFAGLIGGTLKFQLLDYDFWNKAFEKHQTYSSLASASKTLLETQINKEGGSKSDAKVMTDLITTENAKDLVDRNVKNIITFANGKSPELMVYIPVKIIPKSVLPKYLIGIENDMTLTDLLVKLDYKNYEDVNLQGLAKAHLTANLIFFGSIALLLVILILLVLLVEAGGRLVAPGVALFLSGALVVSASRVSEGLKAMSVGSEAGGSSFASILLKSLFQPVVLEFMRTWLVVGLMLMVFGISLFFVRKPR